MACCIGQTFVHKKAKACIDVHARGAVDSTNVALERLLNGILLERLLHGIQLRLRCLRAVIVHLFQVKREEDMSGLCLHDEDMGRCEFSSKFHSVSREISL